MAYTGSTLSALTREKMLPVLIDNIFKSNVLAHKLLRNAEKLDGGAKIVIPIEYADNSSNTGWLDYSHASNWASTTQVKTDIAMKSTWNWATINSAVLLTGEELKINSGASQVLSVLKARMQNAEKSIRDAFGTAQFLDTAPEDYSISSLNGAGTYDGGGTGTVLDDYDNDNGLCVGTLSASGAVYYLPEGGIDGSIIGFDRKVGEIDTDTIGENNFWNSRLCSFEWAIGTVGGATAGAALGLDGGNDEGPITFANFCATSNGVAQGIKAMNFMYQKVSIDGDQPDLIVTTPEIYSAYESALQANKRWQGSDDLGDIGFSSLAYKSAQVVIDSHCPAGHMYFLNTRYLDYKVNTNRSWELEDFRSSEGSDTLQARLYHMCQLTCSNPRMQGLLVGGPTTF